TPVRPRMTQASVALRSSHPPAMALGDGIQIELEFDFLVDNDALLVGPHQLALPTRLPASGRRVKDEHIRVVEAHLKEEANSLQVTVLIDSPGDLAPVCNLIVGSDPIE